MLAAWEDETMTAVADELGFRAELLRVLEETGTRYEVIDGTLVVNPPPVFDHQDVTAELLVQLRLASPAHLAVLPPGYKFFYAPGQQHWLEPDIIVVDRELAERQGIVHPPVLVVEVLSPSTRRTDLTRKREIYESTGVGSYWVVDPDARELTVLELVDGGYVEAARLVGTGELVLDRPFPVIAEPWPLRR